MGAGVSGEWQHDRRSSHTAQLESGRGGGAGGIRGVGGNRGHPLWERGGGQRWEQLQGLVGATRMMKLSRPNSSRGRGGGWGASAGGRGGRGVGNSKHKRGTLPGRLPSSSAARHTMGSCSPHCPGAGGPACCEAGERWSSTTKCKQGTLFNS